MGIVRRDGSDPAVIRACHEVAAAADAVDDPCGPPMTLPQLHGWLAHPFAPTELWVAEGAAGGIAGWCLLRLPDRENLDRGLLDLFVHPASRRGGSGGGLLRRTAERAAAHGRSVLAAEALQGSAGAAFAAAVGATAGLVQTRRVLAVDELPAGRIAVLREQAERAAAGYCLVSWQGRTPDQYLAGFAEVMNASNDMPRDAGKEDEVWDAERVREQVDGLRARRGRHVYTIAALHAASGEMAALTDVEADPESPRWGFQLLTAVTRPHRGHRLGLLVKTAMLEWLAQAEPQLERIITGNAAVNQHMIAINEELGYKLLEPSIQSYEIAVAELGRPPATLRADAD